MTEGGARGSIAATALLVVVALVMAIGAAEVAVRVLGLETDTAVAVSTATPRDPALRDLPNYERRIGRPNLYGVHRGVLHRTNSRGVRGPEYTPNPEPGTFRILLVGDSFAMGHRVNEDETYAAHLERISNEQGNGVRFEVINAGLSGLSTRGVVKRLEQVGLAYDPDLVVYGFSANDIFGSAYRRNTEEQRRAFRAERARFDDSPSRLLRAVWPRLIALRSALAPMPGSHEFALQRAYFESPIAGKQIERGFDRLAEISQERGLCIHVFVHTVIHELNLLHPFRPVYDLVETSARDRGLSASQSFPYFRGERATALRFGPDDNHPTPDGHRLLGLALAEALSALPEECGFPSLGDQD